MIFEIVVDVVAFRRLTLNLQYIIIFYRSCIDLNSRDE